MHPLIVKFILAVVIIVPIFLAFVRAQKALHAIAGTRGYQERPKDKIYLIYAAVAAFVLIAFALNWIVSGFSEEADRLIYIAGGVLACVAVLVMMHPDEMPPDSLQEEYQTKLRVEELELRHQLELKAMRERYGLEPKPEPKPEPPKQEIPADLRTSHTHILAGSNFGKTTLLKSLIAADIQTDASVVVIDSQGDLINEIAPHVAPDRLILVDPQHCPAALNIFARAGTGDAEVARAVELFQYVFTALGVELTGKMATVFRFLCILMLHTPGATVRTMHNVLKNGVPLNDRYLKETPEVVQEFFQGDFNSRTYAETRNDIAGRLNTVLSATTVGRMLNAPSQSINIRQAVDSGKIILINTNKGYLTDQFASLIGRIFLVQLMQAVMSRPQGQRRPTYLYLDEFGDYAEDSQVLFNLFEQGRKYGLGVTVAHQLLNQLGPRLRSTIHANTAVKFVGGASAEDTAVMAREMRVQPNQIDFVRKGTFLAFMRGQLISRTWTVDAGALDKIPTQGSISAIHERMRQRYAADLSPTPPTSTPPSPTNPPSSTGLTASWGTSFTFPYEGTKVSAEPPQPKKGDGEESSSW
ncbi:type IV secretory system conjugative DNA transfer family protein [Palleronia sp. KMU-117]|uniref:type IV secretory system conjugative DNA transfer family protein n=1 Tax=Palleronia sp. KMU-117 TaxID=3434108 RepID=UPI003D705122